MSVENAGAIIERIVENDYDATDVTFDEFMKVMKYTKDDGVVDQILEDHPDYVNKQDKDGKTALIIAAERGWGDAIAVLAKVADISIKDKSGKTAAEYFEKYYREINDIDEDDYYKYIDALVLTRGSGKTSRVGKSRKGKGKGRGKGRKTVRKVVRRKRRI